MKSVKSKNVIKLAKPIKTAPGMYAAECIVEYGFGETKKIKADRDYPASCPFNVFLRFKDKTCGIAACDGLYDLLDFSEKLASAFEGFFLSQAVGRNAVNLPQLGERGVFEWGGYSVWWNIAGCSNNYMQLVGEQVQNFRTGVHGMKSEVRWAVCNVAYNEIAGSLELTRKEAIAWAVKDLGGDQNDWTWKDIKDAGYECRKFRLECVG